MNVYFSFPGRPTEIDEKDIYLCEERYNEHDKEFKKLKGLKVIFFSFFHQHGCLYLSPFVEIHPFTRSSSR